MIPGISKFSELFEDCRYFTSADVNHGGIITPANHINVGHYMAVSRSPDGYIVGAWVRPTQAVIRYIDDNMLAITSDRLHFSAVLFPAANEVRCHVRYGQIIGSRELGCVSLDSMPAWIRCKLRDE